MPSLYETLRDAILAEQPAVVATIIEGAGTGTRMLIRPGAETLGTLGDAALDTAVAHRALELLARAETAAYPFSTPQGEVQVFIESYPPPPTLFIVGAVHIAIPLVTFAKTLGFRTIVIDARGAFATPERFAHADELVHAWPDEALEGRLTINSYVVLLTHDPKLDDPALKVALPAPVRYVGALGSPKTHAKRLERLRDEGMADEYLARLHAPIGLPLGGRTPEEIAVSIIAEIVAVRNGKR